MSLVGGRICPVSRIAFGPQLFARGRLAVHAFLVFHTLLCTRGACGAFVVLDAHVRTALTQQFRPRGHCGLPIEDDAALTWTNDNFSTGHRTCTEQLVLNAGASETVGEVANCLIVGKVCLAHPALDLDAAHLEVVLSAVAHALYGKAGIINGRRANDNGSSLEFWLLGAVVVHELSKRE